MNKIKVIKFGATWCAPCKQVDRVLEFVKQDYPDLKIQMVNIDDPDGQQLAIQFGIKGVPTVVVLNNPESEDPADTVAKWVGGNAGQFLEDFLQDYKNTGELPEPIEHLPTQNITAEPKKIVRRYIKVIADAAVDVSVTAGAIEMDIQDVIVESITKQLSSVGYYNLQINVEAPEPETEGPEARTFQD